MPPAGIFLKRRNRKFTMSGFIVLAVQAGTPMTAKGEALSPAFGREAFGFFFLKISPPEAPLFVRAERKF